MLGNGVVCIELSLALVTRSAGPKGLPGGIPSWRPAQPGRAVSKCLGRKKGLDRLMFCPRNVGELCLGPAFLA